MHDTIEASVGVTSLRSTTAIESFGPHYPLAARRAAAAVIALAGAGLAAGSGWTAGSFPFPSPGPIGR